MISPTSFKKHRPHNKIFPGIAWFVILAILLLAGCAPWESAAPTTPTDTSRPPWLQIYTDIAFDGPSLGLICGWHGTMLRSVDKGQTWSEVVVPSAADLNSVAILNAGTAVAVGSSGNIIRSTDGGQTWIKITSPVNETLNAIASVGGGGAIAVGWHGTIIGTLDGGQTWTRQCQERFYCAGGVF